MLTCRAQGNHRGRPLLCLGPGKGNFCECEGGRALMAVLQQPLCQIFTSVHSIKSAILPHESPVHRRSEVLHIVEHRLSFAQQFRVATGFHVEAQRLGAKVRLLQSQLPIHSRGWDQG